MTESRTEPRARDGAFRGLLAVVAGVLLVPMGIAGLRTYGDLERAEMRKAELSEEIAAAESEIGRLERRISNLESEPEAIERLARSDLGMVFPGEVVIVLPRSSGVPSAPPPSVGAANDEAVPTGPRLVEPGSAPRSGAPASVSTAVTPPGEP